MAVMNDANRIAVWTKYMQDISAIGEACAITKVQLRAAIDAADQWVSDNASSFNSALPTAARNNLTAAQKSRLLRCVLMRRFEAGT